ncbi:MAG: ATP-binding protein [Lachnospiraceae bacterium]|nr:ATP-binding protein [Lachnospiraceae bacterium]
MKPINIYTLTRITDPDGMERLERQMSKRKNHLKIKEWETEGLRLLCDKLYAVNRQAASYDFYYSFTLPKLGKEFDLLRVSEDSVINIELKSGNVSDEVIKIQLKQNRYYLSSLERSIYSFTYISEDDRLVRLTGGDRLIDADAEELFALLEKQSPCYEGDIEPLFSEEKFLISPLTDPNRFLRRDYFLTSGQRDIKRQILRDITEKRTTLKKEFSLHGFTGLPGTGKTILLYDIAMELSVSEKVCILHLGSYEEELSQLNQRLKRVDFYQCEPSDPIRLLDSYAAILVDEGHHLNRAVLEDILDLAKQDNIPVIVSYDKEDAIAPAERNGEGGELLEKTEGFIGYKLTNKIRLNGELSSFISCLMCVTTSGRKYDFPSVSLAFAGDEQEAETILDNFEARGYVYIWDKDLVGDPADDKGVYDQDSRIEANAATCKEFDKIVMMIDDAFCYDESGYLRDKRERMPGQESVVRKLFHGLNRAKNRIAIVVKGNESLFYRILGFMQRKQ